MDARNPKYNANGSIDLEIGHPEFGWTPFTASANDVEEHGVAIFNAAENGDFGTVQPYVAPVPTPEQILAEKKRQRQAIVDSITVTVSTGKVFDGNEDAQRRLNNAVSVAAITGETSCTWVLANNVPTVVTLAEIKEAFALAFQAMGAVWATPYEGE